MEMSLRERAGTRAKVTVSAAILLLKAALGVWASIALLTASADNEKSFLGETIRNRRTGLGLLLLVLAAITVVVVVQLVRLKPWSRPAAIALEVVAVVLALTRIASATGPALVSLVLSAAVITLLLTAGSFERD
jgi:hypothetical protein